jgi:hypothetical protein
MLPDFQQNQYPQESQRDSEDLVPGILRIPRGFDFILLRKMRLKDYILLFFTLN